MNKMNEFTYLKDKDFSKGRRYIGASDIPTLALMNVKYDQTPLTLWEEKTGRREGFKGNERSRAGHELESIILKWGLEKVKEFEKDFFNTFMISRYKGINDFIGMFSFTEARHPKYNFIVSHADLIDNNTPFIMEAKSAGFFGAHRKDDLNYGYDKDDLTENGIPSSVYLQIQTQMLCYAIPIAYVSVMIDTGMHRLYGPIKAHKKTQEKILAISEKFWWYIENDKPPKPETWSDVQTLFPNLDKESKTVISGKDEEKVIEMKDRAKRLRKRKKEIDAELDDMKNAIGLILGENAFLESASGDSLAKAFNVTKQNLKLSDFLDTFPTRYKNLVKEGLIKPNTYRQLSF
jgi:predicted phage-related endonuclease